MPDTIYPLKITADTATMITTHTVEEAAAAAAAAVDTETVVMDDRTTVTVAKTDTTASLQSMRVVSMPTFSASKNAVLMLRCRHSQNRRHCLYQQFAPRSN